MTFKRTYWALKICERKFEAKLDRMLAHKLTQYEPEKSNLITFRVLARLTHFIADLSIEQFFDI